MDKVKAWFWDWVLTTRGMQKKYIAWAHDAEARGDIGERDRYLRESHYIDREVLAPIVWLPLCAFLGLLIWVCSR